MDVYEVRVWYGESGEAGGEDAASFFVSDFPLDLYYHSRDTCYNIFRMFENMTFQNVQVSRVVVGRIESASNRSQVRPACSFRNIYNGVNSPQRKTDSTARDKRVGLLFKNSIEVGQPGQWTLFHCIGDNDYNTVREGLYTLHNVQPFMDAIELMRTELLRVGGASIVCPQRFGAELTAENVIPSRHTVNHPVLWAKRAQYKAKVRQSLINCHYTCGNYADSLEASWQWRLVEYGLYHGMINSQLIDLVRGSGELFQELFALMEGVEEEKQQNSNKKVGIPRVRWGRSWNEQISYVKRLAEEAETHVEVLQLMKTRLTNVDHETNIGIMFDPDVHECHKFLEDYYLAMGRACDFDFMTPHIIAGSDVGEVYYNSSEGDPYYIPHGTTPAENNLPPGTWYNVMTPEGFVGPKTKQYQPHWWRTYDVPSVEL